MRLHTPRILRPYYRNGLEHRAGADVSFTDIVKVFNFRSVAIGRWVTASETQRAANLFFDAFADLQLLLQVPTSVISLQGQLSLTFGRGGERGVCAFYQPHGRVLALAKNAGGGALAHEWFHAFDHYIATKMYPKAAPQTFASDCFLQHVQLHPHPLNHCLESFFQHLLLSPCGRESSALFQRSAAVDAANGRLYYAQPVELAARAFEAVLWAAPLKNHFLVSGLTRGIAQGLYPSADELTPLQAALMQYFTQLGRALSAHTGASVVR